MLVLTRKIGDRIVIDGNIIVEVIKIQGVRVTLGIEAPPSVKILRSELIDPKPENRTMEMIVEDGVLVAC